MMGNNILEELLDKYYQVYDRFTFDFLFRSLLKIGCDYEEAKDTILTHCALSTLVLQERIYNEYYLEINEDDSISSDLLKLKNDIHAESFFKNRKPLMVTRISYEEECIDYAYNLVLNRTYEGYRSEIDTIYGQLESILNLKIHPAPDKWDRSYNVDFYIEVNKKCIGLQIKPISSGIALNQYQWIEMHRKNHLRFFEDKGGKVFFIFSVKSTGKKKKIFNVEVIEEIKTEIARVGSLN